MSVAMVEKLVALVEILVALVEKLSPAGYDDSVQVEYELTELKHCDDTQSQPQP